MLDVIRRAYRIFSGRGARFLGAAIAFYALLSAAPLFVVILHVVGGLVGKARAEDALFTSLQQWIAPEGIATLRQLTTRLDRLEGRGSIFGLLLVVYGSTRLFRALKRALNVLWGVDLEAVERARGTAARYGLRYGGALALALLCALLVAVLAVVKSAIALVTSLGGATTPGFLFAVDVVSSVGFTFVLFTTLFRVLPEVRVTLREAALAGAVSTALFALGSGFVTLYVGHKKTSDLYEGANAIVVLVLWAYYSAQVFFFGAAISAAMRPETSPEMRSETRAET